MHIKEARLFKEIMDVAEARLSAKANPQNVLKYSRYFKEGYDAWGADDSELIMLKQDILQSYPQLNAKQILELGKLLLHHSKFEMGSLAILLLDAKLDMCDRQSFDELKLWFDFGVNNWAHADNLCTKITPWFLLKGIVTYEDFAPWLSSKSRWTRRACPVSMIKIKKLQDPKQMMSFIEILMTDPERVVHQGTGWFLRELWKEHPKEVEDFLYTHRNTAARLIIQYATEKMSKEERLRFRKDKAAIN